MTATAPETVTTSARVLHLPPLPELPDFLRGRSIVVIDGAYAGSVEDGLETPGGLLEPGEDPCVAGARELLEETGYAGGPARLAR